MHRTAFDHSGVETTEEVISYSVPAAAKLIGISPRHMWIRLREGKIRSYRDGTRRLISRQALLDYVQSLESEVAA